MNEHDRKQLELAESYLVKAGEILHSLYATTPSSQAKSAATQTVKINNTEVPAEIAKLIHVAEGGDRYVLTKPWTPHKQDWIDINNFVKDLGGEWVSAGKDSRWEIKKKP